LNLFRNVALAFIIVIAINIGLSMAIEAVMISTELQTIKTSMKVASSDALNRFEVTTFSGFDDNLKESFDIRDRFDRNDYLDYLDEIQRQAIQKNIYEGDIKIINEYLKDELAAYNVKDNIYAPYAFRWTFLEERRLEEQFRESLINLINENYKKANNNYNVDIGLNDIDVEIDGPYLVDLASSQNESSVDHITYMQVFGTPRREAIDMVDDLQNIESFYNYMIVYDVKFTVNKWKHHTMTPMFRQSNYFKFTNNSNYLNDLEQLIVEIKEPITFNKKYVVIN
jgi:hypothetical protein